MAKKTTIKGLKPSLPPLPTSTDGVIKLPEEVAVAARAHYATIEAMRADIQREIDALNRRMAQLQLVEGFLVDKLSRASGIDLLTTPHEFEPNDGLLRPLLAA